MIFEGIIYSAWQLGFAQQEVSIGQSIKNTGDQNFTRLRLWFHLLKCSHETTNEHEWRNRPHNVAEPAR